MDLLLLSNSTNHGENYFEFPLPYIKSFLSGGSKKCLFIPFAGVTISWDDYEKRAQTKFLELGHTLISVHHAENYQKAVEEAEVIVIGGGNTFNLAAHLQKNKLREIIRNRVLSGVPYIGWSAGSNVACPSICTTNDMPIIQPQSFDGINLVSFQINPHFTEATIPNHGGETREARLLEYLEINRDKKVIGLREGSLLQYKNNKAELLGKNGARLFEYNQTPADFQPGDSLSFLF